MLVIRDVGVRRE